MNRDGIPNCKGVKWECYVDALKVLGYEFRLLAASSPASLAFLQTLGAAGFVRRRLKLLPSINGVTSRQSFVLTRLEFRNRGADRLPVPTTTCSK
jgi:hypothetical protein